MQQPNQRMKRDLTSGSISRNIWYLGVPMIVGNLLQNTFSFVDMIFMGWLGPDAIAAVAMGGLVLSMIFTVAIGISMGTVALVARYTGARRFALVENVAVQSLYLGVLGSVFIGTVGYFLSDDILRWLGAAPEVVVRGIPYLQIMFAGSFTMFFVVSLGAVMQGGGDAMTPTIMLAGTTVLNIGLDPLLIFGYWIFPELGVAGSALATVISRGIGMLYLFWKCSGDRGVVNLHMRSLRWDGATMKEIATICIFGSLQSIFRNVSGVVVMRIVAVYGTATVAAYGIGMRLQFMVMMPGFGIANAVATLVGQNLGAGKPEQAEKTAKIATAWGMLIMVLGGVGYIVLAEPLIRIFNASPDVLEQGILYLRVSGGFVGFIGISIILGRAFNGAGDTLSPMVITGIALFLLRIPLALAGAYQWDVLGLFLGLSISTFLQAVIMTFWFRRGNWKKKKVGQGMK